MKNILTTCLFLCLLLTVHAADNPNVKKLFTVTSGELKLTFMVGMDNRLYQLGFGDVAREVEPPAKMPSRDGSFFLLMGTVS